VTLASESFSLWLQQTLLIKMVNPMASSGALAPNAL
jgi:hypothetical protein